MGIEDRDYYRKDGPSFLGGIAEPGKVTAWLIGANVAFFVVQFLTRNAADEPFTDALSLDVNKVLSGQVWRLLSYAFLHDVNSIWHIVFNMMVLFFFGRQAENMLGPREYLAVYLGAAVAGGVAFVAASLAGLQGRPIPLEDGGYFYPTAVGASGAVLGMLVLAAIYDPRKTIYVMFVIPMPQFVVALLLVLSDAFNLLGHKSGNVATSAHLGGAAFCYLYHLTGRRLTAGWRMPGGWLNLKRRPSLRIYREDEEEPTPSPPGRGRTATAPAPTPRLVADDELEAQVDAILAKIPKVGMGGLTEAERQTLIKASEEAKRRRT